jgi:hypothetical protein
MSRTLLLHNTSWLPFCPGASHWAVMAAWIVLTHTSPLIHSFDAHIRHRLCVCLCVRMRECVRVHKALSA